MKCGRSKTRSSHKRPPTLASPALMTDLRPTSACATDVASGLRSGPDETVHTCISLIPTAPATNRRLRSRLRKSAPGPGADSVVDHELQRRRKSDRAPACASRSRATCRARATPGKSRGACFRCAALVRAPHRTADRTGCGRRPPGSTHPPRRLNVVENQAAELKAFQLLGARIL